MVVVADPIDDTSARRPGRPRDASVDQAVLDATTELLADGGISGLSMDLVAKRAGVGKATIYRRWESKEELVLDAMSVSPPGVPPPDTGALRSDLLAYTTSLARKFGSAPTSDILPHLIEAACYDERLRKSLHDYTRTRQQTLRTILHHAYDRGELTDEDDRELIVDMVMGAFFYRRLMSGDPFTPRVAARLVDVVLRQVGV